MEKYKKPWLIQRCTVKSGWKKTSKVSEYLDLDYMGSAEFEFGAVPKCLREIHGKLDKVNPVKLTIGTHTVWILAEPEKVEHYEKWLNVVKDAASEYEPDLKELISLYQILKDKPRPTYRDDNFWIDLDNGIAISLEKGPIMNFKDSVVNSVKFMDEKAKERELQEKVENKRV